MISLDLLLILKCSACGDSLSYTQKNTISPTKRGENIIYVRRCEKCFNDNVGAEPPKSIPKATETPNA